MHKSEIIATSTDHGQISFSIETVCKHFPTELRSVFPRIVSILNAALLGNACKLFRYWTQPRFSRASGLSRKRFSTHLTHLGRSRENKRIQCFAPRHSEHLGRFRGKLASDVLELLTTIWHPPCSLSASFPFSYLRTLCCVCTGKNFPFTMFFIVPMS